MIYKFIPAFGKLMDLTNYKAYSRDKFVNHFCKLLYSSACFLPPFICSKSIPTSLFNFSIFATKIRLLINQLNLKLSLFYDTLQYYKLCMYENSLLTIDKNLFLIKIKSQTT